MSKKEEEEYLEYKLVLMGAGGSGKSCITNMFLSGYFTEDSYVKKTCVDGEIGVLDILDTAGQEEYSAMMDDYMSVTDRASFEAVVKYRNKLYAVKDKDLTEYIPFVLVGNKCDLEDKRQVTTAQGKAVSEQWNCPFLETSAKNNINVSEVFHEIVREIRKDRNVKGYQLKKTKGPDESMTKKIMNKFAKWGALKESVSKLFNKMSRSFSKDKKNSNSSSPASSNTNSTPASTPASSSTNSTPAPSSTPSSPQPATSTPVTLPVTSPPPGYSQPSTSSNPPELFSLPEPDPEPTEDPFDAQATKDIDEWLKDLDETEKKTTNSTQPTTNFTQPAPKQSQPAPKTSRNPPPGVKMSSQPQQGGQGVRKLPPGAQPIFGMQTPSLMHKGTAPPVANKSTAPPAARPLPQTAAAPRRDKREEFKQYSYFFANMSGTEADNALAGQPLGTFIIRFSSQPNHLAEGGINRVLIGYDENHVWMADEPEKYNTLEELVQAYRTVLLHPYSPQNNSNDPSQHYRELKEVIDWRVPLWSSR